MLLIVSPHLDDACLSLGQFAASVAKATIVTVFAGIPSEGLSPYDEACGFTDSSTAMRTRRNEDFDACHALGAEVVHLDFLDAQYQQAADDTQITERLARFYHSDWLIFAPIGIGHPDHVQAARCARAAMPTGTIIAYEELPYRVLWPEQVVDALAKIRAEGFTIGELPYPLEQGDREQKVEAINRYRSQFPAGADDPCLLVPERAWRIAR